MSKLTNQEIWRLANNVLNTIFIESLKELNYIAKDFSLETPLDAGEDFLYMIESRDKSNGNFVFPFYIQNKGRTNCIPIKDKKNENFGKISYQFDVKNVERWYCDFPTPVLITLCDITTKKAYWNTIQLDISIKNRLDEALKNGSKTIQLYFEPVNLISQGSIGRLFAELNSAKKMLDAQYATSKPRLLEYKIVEDSFEDAKSGNLLTDMFNLVTGFEELSLIPKNILVKLYPFSKDIHSKTSCKLFCLYTDNKELYDFFNSLQWVGNIIEYRPNYEKDIDLNLNQVQVQAVIRFLISNHINHIKLNDDLKNQVCIHKLYTPSNCNCERCTYNRLDFKSSLAQLELIKLNEDDPAVLLRNALMMYRYGDYLSAFKLYTSLSEKFLKSKKFISHFVCIYNLSKLYSVVRSTYVEKDRKELLAVLSKIDITREYGLLETRVSPGIYELLGEIKEEKLLKSSVKQLDGLLQRISDNKVSDQFGGASRNDDSDTLSELVINLSSYLDGNLLIYEDFFEYEQIIERAIAGFCESLAIENKASSRTEELGNYLLKLMIFNCDSERLLKILNKNLLFNIVYDPGDDNEDSSIIARALNFMASLPALDAIIHIDKTKDNFYLKKKTQRIADNLLILLARLEIPLDKKEIFLETTLKTIEKYPLLYACLPYVVKYIKLTESLSIGLLEQWLSFAISHRDQYCSRSLIETISDLFASKEIRLSDNNIEQNLLKIVQSKGNNDEKFDIIFDTWPIVSEKTRGTYTRAITDHLGIAFDTDIYYNAAMLDIINYQNLLAKFLNQVPSNQIFEQSIKHFLIIDTSQNSTLDKFINLAYKNNIPLGEYQHLHNDVPYYKWLMNLKEFDYSTFSPYWILKYPTKFYFNEFRKIPQIKTALERYLLKKNTKGILNSYIKLYATTENPSP